MLHNEARELMVEGYEATHDAKGIAKLFHVSEFTVYHLAEQKRKTGSVALRTSHCGRKPVLNDEDKKRIRRRIDEQPDITLAELRTALGLKASVQTLSRVIRAMGYRVKKKSLSASEKERPRSEGKTYQMARSKAVTAERTSGVSGRKQRKY